MVQYRRSLYFVLFLVGVMLLLFGTTAWVIGADQDYSVSFDHVADEPPRLVNNEQPNVGSYGALSPSEQEDFHRAVDEKEILHYETSEETFPNVIERNGQYYVFSKGGHFDWMNPSTFGPVLTALVGLGTVIQTARLEHRLY